MARPLKLLGDRFPPCPAGEPPHRAHHWLLPRVADAPWRCLRCGVEREPPAPPRAGSWPTHAKR